ncbi:MAG: biotin--[acetyl-CoA-carboxylase] ligase [Bryobacterales bacterium]|nr:biotin--[acetyl-CoA-carboxylase] ligase [Bryobacterales bacterium]
MTLDAGRLRARLPGRRIEWLESTVSTMTDAARLAAGGCAPGTVVVAEEQTAGQGRHGRRWHSEKTSGLYLSVFLGREMPAESLAGLTLSLGLAAREAIRRTTGVSCELKWPNDLLAAGRKCAGILVQRTAAGVVAGIGINVNHTAFPADLEPAATSLRLVSGKEHSREDLLVSLLEAIDSRIAAGHARTAGQGERHVTGIGRGQ